MPDTEETPLQLDFGPIVPAQAPDAPEPEPEVESGNYSSCYTCGIDLQALNQAYVDRRKRVYSVNPRKSSAKRAYILSLCGWCSDRFRR